MVPLSSPCPTKISRLPLLTANLKINFFIIIKISSGHCRELVFPQFFFAHKRLVNHNIETLQVNDFDMCRLRCYQEPNCVSINFNLSQDSEGLHNCELNNATHQRHDNELKDKADYYYRGALVRAEFLFIVKFISNYF